jgi:hypothetical protein
MSYIKNTGLNRKGFWNPNTNTPTLGNGGAGGSKGEYYEISPSGTHLIDGISKWFSGDKIANTGSSWEKIEGEPEDLASQVFTTTTGITVQDKLNDYDSTLSKLLPAKPVNLSTKTIALSTSYSAKEESTGTTHSVVTDDTTPAISNVTAFYDGDAGTLSGEVDSVATGSKALTTADDSGTYGDLVIVSDTDPYVGQAGKEGFWKQLSARIQVISALSYALHTLQLKHSTTGDTNLLSFYVDNPVTPSTSGNSVALPGSNTRFISGVPSLATTDDLLVDTSIVNAVGKHYHSTRIGIASSSQTDSNNLVPSTPPAESDTVAFTSKILNVAASAYSENVQVSITPYNSKNVAGTVGNVSTSARVDTVSNESSRLIAGAGQYPSSGYGGAFDSSQSLKTVYTDELQMLNGLLQRPTGNYSGNLPTAGEDYSTGMGTSYRYFIFSAGSQSNITGFTINILGSTGTWSGSNQVTSGLQVYAKVQGAIGWIDANATYPGTGSPSADGDPAMVLASSTYLVKRVTLGSTARSGTLYIRIGIPDGSNKKFTGISVTSIG